MVLSRNLLWLPVERLKDHLIEAIQNLRVAHRTVSDFIPEVRQPWLKTIAAVVEKKGDIQLVAENLPGKWRRDFKHDRLLLGRSE